MSFFSQVDLPSWVASCNPRWWLWCTRESCIVTICLQQTPALDTCLDYFCTRVTIGGKHIKPGSKKCRVRILCKENKIKNENIVKNSGWNILLLRCWVTRVLGKFWGLAALHLADWGPAACLSTWMVAFACMRRLGTFKGGGEWQPKSCRLWSFSLKTCY